MRLLAALLLLAPLAAPAQQRQYVDVGSPDFQPLPLAIAPFRAEGDTQAAATEIAQVLRDDLLLSGLFELVDPAAFLADAGEGVAAPTIRFTRWADVGAEGLAKAVVRRVNGKLAAEFHLYEVRAGREALQRTHEGGPKDARALAHRFADDVVRHYTGERGVFQSRIAAFRKAKAGRELVLFDVDGKGAEVAYREPDVALLPAWRPDGQELLFTSFRSGAPSLWALHVSDRALRQVVSMGQLTSGGVYSPDGKRIAFTVAKDGNSDIWVAEASGSGARQLTKDPGLDTSPSWSPDGRRIAFVSSRSGHPHIYVMNADGSDQRRLTFQGNYNQTPRWSPRGDLIAFTARDERKVFDIFTISPDTGRIGRVTQDQGRTNEEPSWAPNGRLLAFVSDRTGRSQLVISTPTGDRQKVVTSEAVDLATPAWGPLAD
jgi:TolB protein